MLAPYDAEDARGLLKAAIRDPDPVVFLENEILYGESFPVDDKILDKDFTVPIGKVKVSPPFLPWRGRVSPRSSNEAISNMCYRE